MARILSCFAEGRGNIWEAACIDLDIAVQGRSLDEVKQALDRAIATYIDDAMNEQEPTRSQLLNRRAPFFARLSWMWRFFGATLFGRNHGGDSPVGFQIPCRA